MHYTKKEMRARFISLLCGIVAPLSCMASNEGVVVYNSQNAKINANRNAFQKYQQMGYSQYVGKNTPKQILGSRTYSYQVPHQQYIPQNDTYVSIDDKTYSNQTTNGIAQPSDELNTSVYAGYSRRFADFEFKTGVNSILEWDDMMFNEINVGAKHVANLHGFDLAVYGDYTYGKMVGGGLSMDYDLEPYDYAVPYDGIFTISMGSQSGDTSHLRFGVGAHHIWDVAGWKVTPHIGYEIFKHNLQMSDHLYPNPGVYLPLMTDMGDYVFGDVEGNYYAVSIDTPVEDDAGLYQICMGPEDIKIVAAGGSATNISIYPLGTSIQTVDWTSNLGTIPWGVGEGDCVVIGGDGVIEVSGVTHIYNTTWSGFYLGLELEKQMTLADKLRFYVQVSAPKYSSEGTWPNRDDWQQNPSFLDEGDNGAFAYAAEMEYSYKLSDRMQISLKADTNYFHVGNIPGELYVAATTIYVEDEENPGNYIVQEVPAYTEHVTESLQNATWRSFGLHFGVKYAF